MESAEAEWRVASGEDNAVLEIGVEWEALGDPGGGVRGLPDLSAVLVGVEFLVEFWGREVMILEVRSWILAILGRRNFFVVQGELIFRGGGLGSLCHSGEVSHLGSARLEYYAVRSE